MTAEVLAEGQGGTLNGCGGQSYKYELEQVQKKRTVASTHFYTCSENNFSFQLENFQFYLFC